MIEDKKVRLTAYACAIIAQALALCPIAELGDAVGSRNDAKLKERVMRLERHFNKKASKKWRKAFDERYPPS